MNKNTKKHILSVIAFASVMSMATNLTAFAVNETSEELTGKKAISDVTETPAQTPETTDETSAKETPSTQSEDLTEVEVPSEEETGKKGENKGKHGTKDAEEVTEAEDAEEVTEGDEAADAHHGFRNRRKQRNTQNVTAKESGSWDAMKLYEKSFDWNRFRKHNTNKSEEENGSICFDWNKNLESDWSYFKADSFSKRDLQGKTEDSGSLNDGEFTKPESVLIETI